MSRLVRWRWQLAAAHACPGSTHAACSAMRRAPTRPHPMRTGTPSRPSGTTGASYPRPGGAQAGVQADLRRRCHRQPRRGRAQCLRRLREPRRPHRRADGVAARNASPEAGGAPRRSTGKIPPRSVCRVMSKSGGAQLVNLLDWPRSLRNASPQDGCGRAEISCGLIGSVLLSASSPALRAQSWGRQFPVLLDASDPASRYAAVSASSSSPVISAAKPCPTSPGTTACSIRESAPGALFSITLRQSVR